MRKLRFYGAVLVITFLFVAPGLPISAQPSEPSVLCADGSRIPVRVLTSTSCEANGTTQVSDEVSAECMDAEPVAARRTCIEGATGGEAVDDYEVQAECVTLDSGCTIFDYIMIAINVLTAAIGVLIVIMVAIGGVQYISARDNPQAVAAARDRIFNAILALIIYMGIAAFLQWLVPGGVLAP